MRREKNKYRVRTYRWLRRELVINIITINTKEKRMKNKIKRERHIILPFTGGKKYTGCIRVPQS